jgi:hypothetical protein
MTKARTLADFVSSGNPLADGTISVSEVVGAAPLANPTFTGDLTAPEIDLTAIATDITDTAVDVFVYDTSKDSDGGAWRKRTQGTSWYNETLNTATRGSRKEFPAVAVIVVDNDGLYIYDGDDPDMPMWMKANDVSSGMVFNGSTANAVTAKNGTIALASSSALWAMHFVADRGDLRNSARRYGYKGNIEQRNDGLGYIDQETSGALVHHVINDVAMTVLPNAPIDAATGLPVPTIAVATSANVSIIRDNGTVVDITYANYNDARNIYFNSKNHLIYSHYNGATQSAAKVYYEIPSSDLANAQGGYQRGAETVYYAKSGISPDINLGDALHISDISENSFGTSEKLILTDETTPPTSSMINFIASDHQTGWMNGDIKLATLSDTDATNVTGAELVTNGTFASDTAWTKGSGWTIGSGVATASSAGHGSALFQTGASFVGGVTYLVTFTVSNYTTGSLTLYAPRTPTFYRPFLGAAGANGTYAFTYTPTVSSSDIRFEASGTTSLSIDNISIRKAEEDRSVNGNGLQVFGTVTKTAVATGADLVAYSGFSSGNYLQQPYNSDLDFGTGDFSVTFWFNGSGAGNTNLWERGAATGQNFGILTVNGYIYLTGFGANIPIGSPHANAGDASWGHVVLLREAGVWGAYLNGEPVAWAYTNAATLTNTAAVLHLGGNVALTSFANAKKLALMRFSATVPSSEQIAKIYNDEKHLFQENAQATLYGSSDAVTALAYDDTTELLHVGTSAGRSVFQGLRRVENTTDAITAAISASNGLVAEE